MGLYLFSICFCKEPRYRASVNRWLITGISFLCAYTLTWFSELGALKAPFLLTIYLVLLKVCYRDSVYQCAVAEELNYIATTMLSESIGMLIAHWIYQDQMFVLVDGISLLRWEIYVITLSIRIVSFFVIYIICRKFRYRISPKDFLPLTGIFVVAFLPFVFNAFQHLNMNKAGDSVLYVFITVMPFIFITIFLYVKNIIYLREQEQQDKIQIAQLQQQYAYYQDKMKDEERVRSIYHDLKNHLLVMESRQNTAETRQMAETLRSQIADYEDYVHTGNEFLDIILKDKAAKAREKQIDFSAMVDFNGIDFMEPLDISTVIMRYTLRLLTLQQFERASILIFACELLRKKHNLGGNEISIGLWVGGNLTPNHLKEARTSINKQKEGGDDEKSNPVQIKVCPWCGAKLNAQHYDVDLVQNRMIIKCPNQHCNFHTAPNGLPVHIIDDAIYQHLPTFVVATVDKFAQIPLNDKPAALFGITNNKKPPELIIQDELHLISGPLGTMTGIYEAAISKLCERDGICAKVIASTATIRNAANQIMALYGRGHTQFPPQGLSAKDSFFAIQSTPEERPARQYFGVMGIGTTATTTLIRVNAAMLFATRYLATLGYPDAVVDNFWTITGYFNSLRELGGASTQILDDVQSRLDYLAKTKFVSVYPGVDTSKGYTYTEELTSRMSNSEITDIIQVKLKRSYTKDNHADVFDYLLASNMISVGVDVGRLGAMVVAGQPKTNAEYIQATSRVGRDNPGLVIAVYNASRSRDRSHYEQFLKYHSALYRYVEATSLTPFSDRARDRGLHALYVSLCRYLIENLRGNSQAINYRSDNPEIRKVEKIIIDYVRRVDPDELSAVMDELKDIQDAWDIAATGSLVYKSRKNEKKLLKGDTENDRFRMMNSMRNVDGQSGIYLLGGL